jgi:hypothetical protein
MYDTDAYDHCETRQRGRCSNAFFYFSWCFLLQFIAKNTQTHTKQEKMSHIEKN